MPDEIGPALGEGPGRRPSHRARRVYRPGRPPDPPARHLGADPRRRQGAHAEATRTPGGSSSTGVSQKAQEFLPGTKEVMRRCGHSATPSRTPRGSHAAGHPHRALRADPGRAGCRRSGDHDRRDLHLARQRQLRQQDDVVADRGHPDHRPGRGGGGVQPPGRQDGPPAGVRRSSSPTASRAPTCTGGASCRSPGVAPTFATTSRWVRPCSHPPWPRLVGGMGILAALLRREGDGEPPPPSSRRPAERPVTPGDQGRFAGLRCPRPGRPLGSWLPPGWCWPAWMPHPHLSFFTEAEQATVRALVDLLLAQYDEPRGTGGGDGGPRLAAGETDGWHYDDMPEDGEAWRKTLAALDHQATADHGGPLRTAVPRAPSGPRPGRAGRRPVARLHRQAPCGPCGPVTPAPPSTRTRGRGTRSGSAARPIPGATRTSASTDRRGGRSPSPDAAEPAPWAERRERALRVQEQRTRCDPGRQRTSGHIGGPGTTSPMSRLRDADIRARNESAWLVPPRPGPDQPPTSGRHAPLRRG